MQYRTRIKLPTASKVVTAMNAADDADPKSRDTRQLMQILQLLVAYSPRLSGHLLTRRVGAATYPWSITAHDKSDEQGAVDAEVRCGRVIRSLISRHELTPAYGVSLTGLNWEGDHSELIPNVNKHYKPDEIEQYDDVSVAIWNGDKKGSAIKLYEDPNYIIGIDENFLRGGFLRSVIFHELLRHLTIEDWANLNIRLKGIIAGLVKYDELYKLNMSDQEIKEQITVLDEALKAAGNNNFMRASSAMDIQFKSLVEAASASSYKEFKATLEADIAIAALGQANTSELPNQGGSRAALEVLNLIRSDILYYDIMRITQVINEQLLMYDFRLNYGNNENQQTPWVFRFKFDDNEDIEANARMMLAMSQAGGLDMVGPEVYNKLGLTQPTDEDSVIRIGPPKVL
jgi:hypothetical protein